MSDSEDDFMSDKFLVDVPQETTYSSRRAKAQLAGQRRGQAHNARDAPLKEREEQRRREGLNRSLFDEEGDGEAPRGGLGSSTQGAGTSVPKPRDAGQAKAMDFMKKMGWSVGESLGKRRSASPERKNNDKQPKPAEPIRISMWAGRKGLTARSPSPPPLRRLGPDDISPEAHARLEREGDSFRGRWGADFSARDKERKAARARDILVDLDHKKGVKFHPLHADPANPEALPRPLLVRIYPELDGARSRSPSPVVHADAAPAPSANSIAASALNVSAAEKLREQMRRDMLADLGGDDEEQVRFGVKPAETKAEAKQKEDNTAESEGEEPDWDEIVSGTKRVLAMKPDDHLAFLLSQLRNEHKFCFWCGSQFSSWEEMDGPGGCPGEEEDDH